jgi:hypothetical protein
VAGEDSQDAEGQRIAMTVSDILLSLKSHRRTSVLRTDVPPVMLDKAVTHYNEPASGPSTLVEAHSFTGTGTEVIQTTPRVVPTVPPACLWSNTVTVWISHP